jgi:hypothetical protein
MRILRSFLVLLLILTVAGCSRGEEINITPDDTEHNEASALLFKDFIRRLDPEGMTMILDGEPSEDGMVRHLYIDVDGACFSGFRLDDLRIETVFGQFNPVSEWTDGREVQLQDVMQGYVNAIVKEKDINRALLDHTDEHWKDVMVDVRPGELFVRARYHVQGAVSLKILVEVSTGLQMTGKKVWLDNYRLKVNNAEKTSVIRDDIDKLQPILDMEEFVFPLDLREITMDDEKIVFASRVEPKVFEGIRYVYRAGE